jgi:uncharacterized coiled-coil DUF342 family protein
MSSIENKKDAMLEKAEARLKQIDAEVDRLKAKADESEADQKLKVQQRIDDLNEKRQAFRDKVQEIRDAGDDALTDLSHGFEQAWSTLRDAAGRAGARFG